MPQNFAHLHTMASSPPRGRRRIGLSNPRAARAEATEAESRRLEIQYEAELRGIHFAEQEQRLALRIATRNVDAEIPDSDYDGDEFSLNSQIPNDEVQEAPAPVAPVAAAAPRNRNLWQGNHPKLNMVARRYLMQPQRQEMLAVASNDPDRIAEIRGLKRDPSKDFGHDNFKHSALTFINRKTCEELNNDQVFVQNYLLPNSLLNEEVLRQKIKDFQRVAVNTDVEDIDPRTFLFYILI
jgi:hypothetical protein